MNRFHSNSNKTSRIRQKREKKPATVAPVASPTPDASPIPTNEYNKVYQEQKSTDLNVYKPRQVPQPLEYAHGDKCKALRDGKTVRQLAPKALHSGREKSKKSKNGKNGKNGKLATIGDFTYADEDNE
jgi:hypothetical protein